MQLGSDATNVRSASANGPLLLDTKRRTRRGKSRLLTLDALDARTAAAREARNLIGCLAADLGGEDCLTAGQLVAPLADHRAAVNAASRSCAAPAVPDK